MVLRGVVAPVPDWVDEGLLCLRVGKALGVPASRVVEQPLHLVTAALVDMAATNIAQKRAMDQARARQRKPTPRARR